MDFIKDEATRIARMVDDRDREETTAEYRRYANKAGVNNLTQLASVELLAKAEDFDPDDYALCASNGWINLKTGNLQRHDPAKRFSMVLCCFRAWTGLLKRLLGRCLVATLTS